MPNTGIDPELLWQLHEALLVCICGVGVLVVFTLMLYAALLVQLGRSEPGARG